MKNFKRVVFIAALALIAGTALLLVQLKSRQILGQPGVKVAHAPIFDPDGKLVSEQSIILPEKILDAQSRALPITQMEVTGLPKDTTFGKRFYRFPDNFQASINVVLMGTDRTSIHQPQFCLVGQGWGIDQTEQVSLRIERPVPYELEAMKLTTSIRSKDEHGEPKTVHGIYVYWFVAENHLTAQQGKRMWSMAKTLLQKGVLERWAYVSYFATCLPGQEQATFDRLKKIINASTPEFQITTGKLVPQISAVAAKMESP